MLVVFATPFRYTACGQLSEYADRAAKIMHYDPKIDASSTNIFQIRIFCVAASLRRCGPMCTSEYLAEKHVSRSLSKLELNNTC